MCVRQYGYRGEEEKEKKGWAKTYLFNDKLGSLGILLSNLFLLDGGSELLSEAVRYINTRSVSGVFVLITFDELNSCYGCYSRHVRL